MPRPGDGSSHNGPFEEAGHNIAHGVGSVDVGFFSSFFPLCLAMPKKFPPTNKWRQTSKVPRAEKTADLPEGLGEQGAGIKGANASGGQSQGLKTGGEVGQGGRHA